MSTIIEEARTQLREQGIEKLTPPRLARLIAGNSNGETSVAEAEVLVADAIAAGCPTEAGGKLDFLTYTAWLVGELRQRRPRG